MKFLSLITSELDNIRPSQRWRIVALLVSKKPVAIAANNVDKTHPSNAKFNPDSRLHAEIRCLRAAPYEKIKDSIMYVFRVDSDGDFRMAKPCAMCMHFLEEADIRKVIYSTNVGFEELKI